MNSTIVIARARPAHPRAVDKPTPPLDTLTALSKCTCPKCGEYIVIHEERRGFDVKGGVDGITYNADCRTCGCVTRVVVYMQERAEVAP